MARISCSSLSHDGEAERKKAISAILYCTILLKRRRRRRKRRRDSLSQPLSRFLLSHPIPNPPAPSHRFPKIVLPAELIPILRPPTSLFHANWPHLQKEKNYKIRRIASNFNGDQKREKSSNLHLASTQIGFPKQIGSKDRERLDLNFGTLHFPVARC